MQVQHNCNAETVNVERTAVLSKEAISNQHLVQRSGKEVCYEANLKNDDWILADQKSLSKISQQHKNMAFYSEAPVQYYEKLQRENNWFRDELLRYRHEFENMRNEIDKLRRENLILRNENIRYRRTFENNLPDNVDLSTIIVSWRFRDPHFASLAHHDSYDSKHRQVVLSEHVQRGMTSDVVQRSVMVNNATNVLLHQDSAALLHCDTSFCHNVGSRPLIDWVPYNNAVGEKSYLRTGSYSCLPAEPQLGSSIGQRVGVEMSHNSVALDRSMISASSEYHSRSVAGFDNVRKTSPLSAVGYFDKQNGDPLVHVSQRFAAPPVCDQRSSRDCPKYDLYTQNDTIRNLLQQPKAMGQCAVDMGNPVFDQMCFNPRLNSSAPTSWSKKLVPFTDAAGTRPFLNKVLTHQPSLSSDVVASQSPAAKAVMSMKPMTHRMSSQVPINMPTSISSVTHGQKWPGGPRFDNPAVPLNKWKHNSSQPVTCHKESRSIIVTDIADVPTVLDKCFSQYNYMTSLAPSDCPSVSSPYSSKCSLSSSFANSVMHGSNTLDDTLLVPSPDTKLASDCGEIDILAKATEELFSPSSGEQLMEEDTDLLGNESSGFSCVSVMQPKEYEIPAQKAPTNLAVLENTIDSQDSGNFSNKCDSIQMPLNLSGVEFENNSDTSQQKCGDMLQLLVLNNQGYLETAGKISSGSLEGHKAIAVQYCRMEDLTNDNTCLSDSECINSCEQNSPDERCIKQHENLELLDKERTVPTDCAKVVWDEGAMSNSASSSNITKAECLTDRDCVSCPSTGPQQTSDGGSDVEMTMKLNERLETFVVTFSENDLYDMVDRVENMQTVGESQKRKRLDDEEDVSNKRRQRNEHVMLKDVGVAEDNCGSQKEAFGFEPVNIANGIEQNIENRLVLSDPAVVSGDQHSVRNTNSNAGVNYEISKGLNVVESKCLSEELVSDSSGEVHYNEPVESKLIQKDDLPDVETTLSKSDYDDSNSSGSWTSNESCDKDDKVFVQHTQDENLSEQRELTAKNPCLVSDESEDVPYTKSIEVGESKLIQNDNLAALQTTLSKSDYDDSNSSGSWVSNDSCSKNDKVFVQHSQDEYLSEQGGLTAKNHHLVSDKSENVPYIEPIEVGESKLMQEDDRAALQTTLSKSDYDDSNSSGSWTSNESCDKDDKVFVQHSQDEDLSEQRELTAKNHHLVSDKSEDVPYIESIEVGESKLMQEDDRAALQTTLSKSDYDDSNSSGSWTSNESCDKDDKVFVQHSQDEDLSEQRELTAKNHHLVSDKSEDVPYIESIEEGESKLMQEGDRAALQTTLSKSDYDDSYSSGSWLSNDSCSKNDKVFVQHTQDEDLSEQRELTAKNHHLVSDKSEDVPYIESIEVGESKLMQEDDRAALQTTLSKSDYDDSNSSGSWTSNDCCDKDDKVFVQHTQDEDLSEQRDLTAKNQHLVSDKSEDNHYNEPIKVEESKHIQADDLLAVKTTLSIIDYDGINSSGSWTSNACCDKDDEVFMQHSQDEDLSQQRELTSTNRRNCFDFLNELASIRRQKPDACTSTNVAWLHANNKKSVPAERAQQHSVKDMLYIKNRVKNVDDKTIGARDLYLSSGFTHSFHSSSSSGYSGKSNTDTVQAEDVSTGFEVYDRAAVYDSNLLSTNNEPVEVTLPQTTIMQRCLSSIDTDNSENNVCQSYDSSSPSPPPLSPSNSFSYSMPVCRSPHNSETSSECCPTLESDVIIDSDRSKAEKFEDVSTNDYIDDEKDNNEKTPQRFFSQNSLKNKELLLAQNHCTECVVELCSKDCKYFELHRLQRIQLSAIDSSCSRIKSVNGH